MKKDNPFNEGYKDESERKRAKKTITEGKKDGRPCYYPTEEEALEKMSEYFQRKTDDEGNWDSPPSETGLALYMGYADKRPLRANALKEDGIGYAFSRALLAIESFYEEKLGDRNVTGAIFYLKNKGWEDKQTIVNTTPPKIEFTDEDETN